MTFQRILVPVDFSPHANDALRLALALANRYRSVIQVLHVDPLPGVGTVAVEPIYIAPQLFEGMHAEHDAKVANNLREIHDELEAKARPGVTVKTTLKRGEAVSGILELARSWPADLMIMGSQGAGGLAQMLLGGTAEKVSAVAPCPVLIAGRGDFTRMEAPRFQRVIAAIDYSELSPEVARAAAAMVEPGGSLELMHVWYPPHVSAMSATLGGTRAELGTMLESGRRSQVEMMQRFAQDIELPDIDISYYIGTGTPAAAILARAEEASADLVVLGSHGRSGVGERLLGTVADRVLRHAQVPVLLYPERAASPEDQ